MKDYERYMNRQRMSETGMAKLLKLETERPEKRETAGKEREVLPRWVKYLGMAASLVLVVGLFALPIVRQARQRAISWPTQEELTFRRVDSVPFTDKAIAGGMGLHTMEPAEAAEIFGCAPDDFVGFLETVGLNNFDMEYYAVDMAHYSLGVAPQGDDGYRFLMKGSYISPREKPENWDEISETDWEMWKGVSNFFPGNDVWLEIYEGHSYQDEADWKALEPQTFHGCQVTAAYDENNYHAAAAFDLESGGKTYGVLYSVTADGERNAKELVTQMVRYLTANGLSIPGNKLVFNEVEQVPASMGDAVLGDHSHEMTISDIAMILHSHEDQWDDLREKLGWTDFDVGGASASWGRDPETDYPTNRFMLRGKDGQRNCFELELRPNHRFYEEEWAGLETSQINGHTVTAVSGFDTATRLYRAAAAFEVEDVICDYGVYYVAMHKDRETAEGMVTQATESLTRNGVFTEMYRSYGGFVMDYDQLTRIGAQRPGMTVGDSRTLSREEIEWVFPPLAEDDSAWSGTVYFYPDGTVGSIVLSGFTDYVSVSAGTALRHVTIVMGKEEETFRDNYVDGGYIGAETEGYRDNRLRGYWRHDPDYIWGSDADDLGADVFVCQLDPNLGWVAEIITSQKDGTFDENRWLNTDWVMKAMGNLWWKDDLTMETDGIFVREYATLGELRSAVDEKFLPYLPTTLMDHDEFYGTWRRNNAEYESVDVRWDKPWIIDGSYARFSYSEDIDVKWPLVAMGLPEVTDVNDRENYDFRKHPGLQFPDGSQGYEGIYEKLYCPTFRAKDASLDLIESRIYHWDPEDEIDGYPEAKTECRFQLLHDNNVLVNYLFQGMTAEEIWKVVESTLPTQLLGPYFMETDEDTAFVPRIVFYADGGFSCVSDLASSHYCVGRYSVQNGRVTAGCDQHRFVFEIDGDALRYVGAASDKMVRYIAPEVTDGTVFRHETDEDGNVLDYDHTPIQYGKYQTSVANVRTGETDAVLIEQS